ncbi:MAG: glycoside hydrolase family 38 [bacterium]|nr:glycoside hydrolase family 38 [bacterium]
MADSKTTAYYVASTHWDREWYEPFQHYRYHLVEIMDQVLDTMTADERFACFQTDGHSVLVEDYLEIRPERAEQVHRFAADQRLRIGPWYTLPDENIVAPESLIRNLEEGIRVARQFGGVSRVGFVCDLFGHVSQLPQILRGFGIDSAFVFRGVNEDTHRGLFRWQASDGSEVVAARFGPKDGYFDYGAQVRKAFDHDVPFVLEEAIERLVKYVDVQRERTGLDTILLFDGGDHMPIDPRTPDLLAGLVRARPDVEVRHTGLDEFAAAIAGRREEISRVFQGELRDPGRLPDGAWVIPGVLSSRIRLKQANRAAETELCFWAEPFGHLAARLDGVEYPQAFIRRAWRYVLQNHAHDSICGCSPDQIHKDMEFRFDQARLINGKIIGEALGAIAGRVKLPDLTGEDFAMVVFNPTQAPIEGPVDLELWFDEKTKSTFAEFFGYEDKVGFRMFDADGREMPYDFLGYAPQRRRFHRPPNKTCLGQECIVVDVCVPLKIPAFGYTTVVCKPLAEPTRHPTGRIVVGDRTLENDHLRLEVQANGSLCLHDKRSGQTYDRLLVFEERADIGDGWYHGVAANDRIHTSTACAADVAVVENGAQKATLKISNRMQVPQGFEFDTKMRRSDNTVTLVIDNYVTLRAGADHVEIRTVIDNNVRDHRIRVMFESGAQTDTYLADSAFDVVERKIALPPDNHTYKELAVETAPQANWTAVFDDGRGLAVVAPDLPETAVGDVPERTLALTLLRGFRRTIFTDGEEGGQSLGGHEFNYRLVPLSGRPSYTRLAEIAQRTAAGIRAIQVLPRDQATESDRTLSTTFGQLSLDPGRAVVSALRRHPEHDRLELRVFNPADEAVDEKLIFADPVDSATLVDLEGNEQGPLTVDAQGRIELHVAARKIVTVALRFSWASGK